MIRRPPRSTQSRSSAASDVYKRQTGDNANIEDSNCWKWSARANQPSVRTSCLKGGSCRCEDWENSFLGVCSAQSWVFIFLPGGARLSETPGTAWEKSDNPGLRRADPQERIFPILASAAPSLQTRRPHAGLICTSAPFPAVAVFYVSLVPSLLTNFATVTLSSHPPRPLIPLAQPGDHQPALLILFRQNHPFSPKIQGSLRCYVLQSLARIQIQQVADGHGRLLRHLHHRFSIFVPVQEDWFL